MQWFPHSHTRGKPCKIGQKSDSEVLRIRLRNNETEHHPFPMATKKITWISAAELHLGEGVSFLYNLQALIPNLGNKREEENQDHSFFTQKLST